MTNDEHNPEGIDHAAQGHYLAASKATPPDAIVYAANNPAHNTMPVGNYDGPTVYFSGSQITPPAAAPTPTLPDEVREAIAEALGSYTQAQQDAICAALAPLWPRPAPVTPDAMALWKQAKGAYLFGTYRHEDNANDKAAAVLAPVLRERDGLRAEVLRLQGNASMNADQLATAERVLDAYRVQLAEAKQESRHD